MAWWSGRLGNKHLTLKIALISSDRRDWKLCLHRASSHGGRNGYGSDLVFNEGVLEPPEDVVRDGFCNRDVRVSGEP